MSVLASKPLIEKRTNCNGQRIHQSSIETQNTTYFVLLFTKRDDRNWTSNAEYRIWGTNGRFLEGTGDIRERGVHVGGSCQGQAIAALNAMYPQGAKDTIDNPALNYVSECESTGTSYYQAGPETTGHIITVRSDCGQEETFYVGHWGVLHEDDVCSGDDCPITG